MNRGESVIINDQKLIYVCNHGNLGDGDAIKVNLNEDIEAALFYIDGKYYALNNECPHNHLRKIDKGFVKKHTVSCPMHGWTYSLISGENIKNGASLDTYSVVKIDENIYIKDPKPKRPKWMDSF